MFCIQKKKKGGKQTSSEWQLTYTEIGVCVVQVHVYSGPELVGLWLLSAELTAASAAGGGEGELFFASSFTGDATGEGDRETFLWCFFSFLDFFFVRSAGLALRLGDFSVFLDLLLDFLNETGSGEADFLEERFSGVLLRLDFLDETGSGEADFLEERFSGVLLRLDFLDKTGSGEADSLEERFSGDLDRCFSGLLLCLLDDTGSGDTDCLEERFSGDLRGRFSGVLSRLDFLGEVGSGDADSLEERLSGDLSVLLRLRIGLVSLPRLGDKERDRLRWRESLCSRSLLGRLLCGGLRDLRLRRDAGDCDTEPRLLGERERFRTRPFERDRERE